MERGAWQTTVHGVANSQDMTEHAHTNVHTHTKKQLCTIQRNNGEKSKDLRKSAMKIHEDPLGVYAEFVRHLLHSRI